MNVGRAPCPHCGLNKLNAWYDRDGEFWWIFCEACGYEEDEYDHERRINRHYDNNA